MVVGFGCLHVAEKLLFESEKFLRAYKRRLLHYGHQRLEQTSGNGQTLSGVRRWRLCRRPAIKMKIGFGIALEPGLSVGFLYAVINNVLVGTMMINGTAPMFLM